MEQTGTDPSSGGGVSNAPVPAVSSSPDRKTNEERKAALAQMVANVSAQGFRVESQSDYQAIIVKGKPVNHTLHIILSVLTVGIWLIVYAILAIAGGEKREMVQVDEWGNIARQQL